MDEMEIDIFLLEAFLVFCFAVDMHSLRGVAGRVGIFRTDQSVLGDREELIVLMLMLLSIWM